MAILGWNLKLKLSYQRSNQCNALFLGILICFLFIMCTIPFWPVKSSQKKYSIMCFSFQIKFLSVIFFFCCELLDVTVALVDTSAFKSHVISANFFCRNHKITAGSRSECGTRCLLGEANDSCAAFLFIPNATSIDASICQCGRAECYDKDIPETTPTTVDVNMLCERLVEGDFSM